MARNWDYAELSKAAKAAGGPEKYIELLEKASEKSGKLEIFSVDWGCRSGVFVTYRSND